MFGRDALRTTLISSGILGADAYVVVAGPANVYAHYVTTREEYAVQRYEGASTLFGPCASVSAPSSWLLASKLVALIRNPLLINFMLIFLSFSSYFGSLH